MSSINPIPQHYPHLYIEDKNTDIKTNEISVTLSESNKSIAEVVTYFIKAQAPVTDTTAFFHKEVTVINKYRAAREAYNNAEHLFKNSKTQADEAVKLLSIKNTPQALAYDTHQHKLVSLKSSALQRTGTYLALSKNLSQTRDALVSATEELEKRGLAMMEAVNHAKAVYITKEKASKIASENLSLIISKKHAMDEIYKKMNSEYEKIKHKSKEIEESILSASISAFDIKKELQDARIVVEYTAQETDRAHRRYKAMQRDYKAFMKDAGEALFFVSNEEHRI